MQREKGLLGELSRLVASISLTGSVGCLPGSCPAREALGKLTRFGLLVSTDRASFFCRATSYMACYGSSPSARTLGSFRSGGFASEFPRFCCRQRRRLDHADHRGHDQLSAACLATIRFAVRTIPSGGLPRLGSLPSAGCPARGSFFRGLLLCSGCG